MSNYGVYFHFSIIIFRVLWEEIHFCLNYSNISSINYWFTYSENVIFHMKWFLLRNFNSNSFLDIYLKQSQINYWHQSVMVNILNHFWVYILSYFDLKRKKLKLLFCYSHTYICRIVYTYITEQKFEWWHISVKMVWKL